MAKLFSKERKRKILQWILPPVVYFFVKLLYLSCKKEFHITSSAPSQPFICAVWHGELLMMSSIYTEYRKSTNVQAIISQHFDGEMIAKLIQLFGGKAIRGSSSKGGSAVLRQALKAISEGYDIAITPDGPRGPKHTVADGLVLLSQMRDIPIVTINCKPSSFWKLGSWDAFCIPKPFSTLNVYISDPFKITGLAMDEAKEKIKEQLLRHAL